MIMLSHRAPLSNQWGFFKSLICLLIYLSVINNGWAHITDTTYTTAWLAEPGIKIVYVVPTGDLAELHQVDNQATVIQPPIAYVDDILDGYSVSNNGVFCVPELQAYQALEQLPSYQYVLLFHCDEKPMDIVINYSLFNDIPEVHENLIDIHVGAKKLDLVLSVYQPSIEVLVKDVLREADRGLADEFPVEDFVDIKISRFFGLGIEHILIGIDHVLFVFGLLLVAMSLRTLLLLISCFTVGHCITLILAGFDYLSINLRFAESVIALSIVYVAVDNIIRLSLSKHQISQDSKNNWRWRCSLVFLFGLIHGFGFSSVLKDIGLPQEGLAQALLLFNLGIEVGQLLIIAVVLPLVWWVWKKWDYQNFSILLSVATGLLGCYWFVERALL